MSDESVRDSGVVKIDEAVSVLAGIAAVTPPSDTYGGSLPPRMAATTGVVRTCTTLAELKTAVGLGGDVRISGTIDVGADVNLILTTAGTAGSPNMLSGGKLIGRLLVSASYWRIRNVEVTGSGSQGIRLIGAGVAFVEIDGCWIHHVGSKGIQIEGTDVQVWNNLVEQCGIFGAASATNLHCVSAEVVARLTVCNNILKPRLGFGVGLLPGASAVVCAGNLTQGGVTRGGYSISGATGTRIVGDVVTGSPTGAFEITSASAPTTTIQDCVQHGNTQGQWATGYVAAATVTNLVAQNPLLTSDGHLQAGSPCVSHVQASRYPFLPAVDKAGAARVTADAGCFAA